MSGGGWAGHPGGGALGMRAPASLLVDMTGPGGQAERFLPALQPQASCPWAPRQVDDLQLPGGKSALIEQ